LPAHLINPQLPVSPSVQRKRHWAVTILFHAFPVETLDFGQHPIHARDAVREWLAVRRNKIRHAQHGPCSGSRLWDGNDFARPPAHQENRQNQSRRRNEVSETRPRAEGFPWPMKAGQVSEADLPDAVGGEEVIALHNVASKLSATARFVPP
jgi:hypothetical protein